VPEARDQDYDQRYWNKPEDLEQDIKDLIEKIRSRQTLTETESAKFLPADQG